MKLNRTYLFITLSSVALLIVLVIQVNWIFETARVKEELFKEKANMVLSKTADALLKDTSLYKNLQFHVGNAEVRKIDSLFKHYMKFYNIQIHYFFNVQQLLPSVTSSGYPGVYTPQAPGCYQACVKEGSGNTKGLDLKLVFPDQEEFIMEEMGTQFITSVLLIIVVMIMSWQTILSLLKEKKISEHTTEFLNNMTHEFKTPITNIALAGKMIVKDPMVKQEDKVKYYTGIILEENDKLRMQVEQVLSMTALERGEIPLQKTKLDFHELLNSAVKSFSLQVESMHGGIEFNPSAVNSIIAGDKTHLLNAICNLIDNALKYSDEKPRILIETFNTDGHLVFVISDNGIGIDTEYHKKVFDKFFRVPTGNVHDVKGFGLGLAYVKKIVELHEGSIVLNSERGKGTVVTITLPNAETEA